MSPFRLHLCPFRGVGVPQAQGAGGGVRQSRFPAALKPLLTGAPSAGGSLSGRLLLPEAVLWMGSASLPRQRSQMVLLRLTRRKPILCFAKLGKQRLPGQRPAGTLRAGGRPDSEPACPCGGPGPSSTGFAVRKRSPLRPGEVSAETRAPPLRMPP